MKTCKQCSQSFSVTDVDRRFYEKISVPGPTLCPDCRAQRRLACRNERSLYRRNCDLTGKSIVSFYPPNSPYKVYAQDVWWGDQWDPFAFGRDFDFSRPFFEQFDELMKAVPHMAMIISHGENSDYCAHSGHYKNCYMCVSGMYGEDLFYCYWTNRSRDCMDCYGGFRCELCYECILCDRLYNSIFCQDCDNGSDLAFCSNCDDCKRCIGCFGLKNREYYVFNKKVSPAEYEKKNAEIHSSPQQIRNIQAQAQAHALKYPHRAGQIINTENSSGDHLINCRNARHCYMGENLEDCAYLWNAPIGNKDCMDAIYIAESELVYEGIGVVHSYNELCSSFCWDDKNIAYSSECFYCNDIFGCVGLKHKEYCILNKPYTKEAYEALLPKIIEHMKKSGEWGEFPPVTLSLFAYNESIAQYVFPLDKNQVLERGWKWSDVEQPLPDVKKIIPAVRLPENITNIPDDILSWAIQCEETGRFFKIVPGELAFYRKMRLPVPRLHPDQRYRKRLVLVNPHRLFDRQCAKCGKAIQTTYFPDRSEKVYCEQCYLKEVY